MSGHHESDVIVNPIQTKCWSDSLLIKLLHFNIDLWISAELKRINLDVTHKEVGGISSI